MEMLKTIFPNQTGIGSKTDTEENVAAVHCKTLHYREQRERLIKLKLSCRNNLLITIY